MVIGILIGTVIGWNLCLLWLSYEDEKTDEEISNEYERYMQERERKEE